MKKIVLYAPKKYWECDTELIDRITGGCGPGGFGDYLVPDTLWGLPVKEPCRIHDFYYSPMMPATPECKEEGDRVFLNNMVRVVKAKTKNRILLWLRLRRANKYYLAVKTFGGSAFWKGKNDAECVKEVAV